MPSPFPASLVLCTALALSIGWGIRGNYGHEFGALLPGALAAMTGALLSGRPDWYRRVAWFGFLGAIGWSFGGSISYMQVIAYTHSGHSGTILYGFASLFLIGFLWAAMGGAGTALPALWDRQQLGRLLPALITVAVAWTLQSAIEARLEGNPDFRHQDPLYWYDTDWLAATSAPVAVLLCAALRRRWDPGSSLVMHMAVGWWIGFLVLVNLLGLRMTPPRGDSWSGCLGMTLGLWVWLVRQGLLPVLLASWVAGLMGGFGFATAALLELVELKSGAQTNWHSILEQTYGAINGLGIALVFALLRRHAPVLADGDSPSTWRRLAPVSFVAIGIPWLNLQKNPADWIHSQAIPESLYGISSGFWFHAAFALSAATLLWMLVRQGRRPLALLPTDDRGRSQVLLLFLLWFMVVGNLARALPGFQAQRLVTEGVLQVNALLLSLGIVLSEPVLCAVTPVGIRWWRLIGRTVAVGTAGFIVSVMADWAAVRLLYGDRPAGFHRLHIRFGPNATATREKPKPGQPHP